MSLISFTPITDGSTSAASQVNTPLSTIYNDYNGNITDANIAANAAIAASKVNMASLRNPYKFSVYRNGAFSTPNNALTLMTFDATTFDTSSNYSVSTGKFTAPVAGFYFFTTNIDFASAAASALCSLYVNGSEVKRGYPPNSSTFGVGVSSLLQLSANDYVQVYYSTPSVLTGTTGAVFTYFQGFFISAT